MEVNRYPTWDGHFGMLGFPFQSPWKMFDSSTTVWGFEALINVKVHNVKVPFKRSCLLRHIHLKTTSSRKLPWLERRDASGLAKRADKVARGPYGFSFFIENILGLWYSEGNDRIPKWRTHCFSRLATICWGCRFLSSCVITFQWHQWDHIDSNTRRCCVRTENEVGLDDEGILGGTVNIVLAKLHFIELRTYVLQ